MSSHLKKAAGHRQSRRGCEKRYEKLEIRELASELIANDNLLELETTRAKESEAY